MATEAEFSRQLIPLILKGGDFRWPADRDFPASFLKVCRDEGMAGVVYLALRDSGSWADVPALIRSGLIASAAAAKEVRERVDAEIAKTLQELAAYGIRVLLFKGCALAHVLYREPWLRLGCDSDLLVRAGDRERVHQVLTGLGYEKMPSISGDLLVKAATYVRSKNGSTFVLDVQWDFALQVLHGLLAFDALEPRGLAIPDIGPLARTFSGVDSLIHACAHWQKHSLSFSKLIWLFDIHLLVRSLSETEQEDFCRVAEQKQVCAICLHTLRQAEERFGTKIPVKLLAALSAGESKGSEASARLLREKTRTARVMGNFMTIRGWRGRMQLACEYLFPPATYMRHRYRHANPAFLPLLYLHRAVKGAAKSWRGGRTLRGRKTGNAY